MTRLMLLDRGEELSEANCRELTSAWARHAPAISSSAARAARSAFERGQAVFSLERALLARVPARWLPLAIDALDVLQKLRHPFTPSLYLGSAEACLAGVREKYNRQAEVRAYSCLAPTELDVLEREIVERHVTPGGRILDIGCGAGREAASPEQDSGADLLDLFLSLRTELSASMSWRWPALSWPDS
jgi:hypothetical protein